MDAELYVRTVKQFCEWFLCTDCPLYDEECCVCQSYTGDINPIPIVEQWLADHPEPKPLPGLPEKFPADYTIDIYVTINELIDYLAAREKQEKLK